MVDSAFHGIDNLSLKLSNLINKTNRMKEGDEEIERLREYETGTDEGWENGTKETCRYLEIRNLNQSKESQGSNKSEQISIKLNIRSPRNSMAK